MMTQKALRGLVLRNGVWHIDKVFYGKRICESAKTSSLPHARKLLALRVYQIREMHLYGTGFEQSAVQFNATILHGNGAKRFRLLQANGISFQHAAERYLGMARQKSGPDRARRALKNLLPFVGKLHLRKVHQETLQPFIDARLNAGACASTINRELAVVRTVLNLSSRVWRDEAGFPLLGVVPFIPRLQHPYARQPYPLSFGEQVLLFSELDEHLQQMALFKVNTGLRSAEVTNLRWNWEVRIPELNATMFVIPREIAKAGRSRCIFLNKVARRVIAESRGRHSEFVFTRAGQPLKSMNNSGWKSARERAAGRYVSELGRPCPAAFRSIRVHDLRHTFGHRLRAAGVGFEDRIILLGHSMNLHMGTYYSAGEVRSLIASVEKIGRPEKNNIPIALARCEADGHFHDGQGAAVKLRNFKTPDQIREVRSWTPTTYRYV